MNFNFKISLVAAAALLTTSASFAQFGGLLNNLKKQVEQAQSQAAPAPAMPAPAAAPGGISMPAMPGMPGMPGGNAAEPAEPAEPAGRAAPAARTAPAARPAPNAPTARTVPAAPAAAPQAAAGNVRQKWLDDPYPDIPKEVSDQDIQATTVASVNKIFVYLNSPVMAKAYKQCQTVEEARVGARGVELRKAADSAKTNSERSQLQEQAAAIESLKKKIAPTTCLLRVVRRATLDLDLEYYLTQPKYGGPKQPDEQFSVVQVFKVARALEKNELTNAFHTAMADEISINYNDWIEKYLTKVAKANVEEMKKQVPANDRKTREQLDAGAEMGVARRVEYYNQVVNVIVGWLSNDVVKP
jgi:hypothetical protein